MRKALLVLLFVAPSLLAQTQRETLTIEVVDVPVYVAKNGEPVRDLTRDNFKLFVNGKPQTIEYFDVVDSIGVKEEQQKLPPEQRFRERRLFLLVFDLMFTEPARTARAQKAALTMIDEASPNDTFAI